MNATAIVILVLGVLFFAASFFLPDGKKKEAAETPQIDEKLIKDMVEKEVSDAKERIGEMVEETVNYSVEKTERQLEKISNEKIMAVEEFSGTVLKKINDNHQEAVFLYDMLNDKGEKLKNSDEQLKALNDELKEKDRQLEIREEVLKAKDEAIKEMEKERNNNAFIPFMPERVEVVQEAPRTSTERMRPPVTDIPSFLTEAGEDSKKENKEEVPEKSKEKKPRTVKKPVTGKNDKLPQIPVSADADAGSDTSEKSVLLSNENSGDVELHFDRDNESRKNNNELIRKMHEEGKSNMAIAKELGLGMGEVKLVIDLFSKKK